MKQRRPPSLFHLQYFTQVRALSRTPKVHIQLRGIEAGVSKLLIATTEPYTASVELGKWGHKNVTVTGRQNPETEMAEKPKKADYNYQQKTGPAPSSFTRLQVPSRHKEPRVEDQGWGPWGTRDPATPGICLNGPPCAAPRQHKPLAAAPSTDTTAECQDHSWTLGPAVAAAAFQASTMGLTVLQACLREKSDSQFAGWCDIYDITSSCQAWDTAVSRANLWFRFLSSITRFWDPWNSRYHWWGDVGRASRCSNPVCEC